MLYDMILMCNDIECLRAKRWFAIAIRHGQPGFAALRCSSYCCHQWHWPLAGNCVSRRASEFERNYWHLLFFFLNYIYTVSLRAVPFMIFYLLCVLCPLPASRIHLHRGCVLRARSQALCECHPVRHAARISTSYKGVNACYWLLLHHIASLCHATDPTDDANHIFFWWSESECLVRQNLAKLLIPLLGGVVIDHLGHLGSICDKASIFVHLMWHYIWYVFFFLIECFIWCPWCKVQSHLPFAEQIV